VPIPLAAWVYGRYALCQKWYITNIYCKDKLACFISSREAFGLALIIGGVGAFAITV
jgi:hypothetical protein